MEFILKVELGETTVALIERILNTKAGVAPLVMSPAKTPEVKAPAADLFTQAEEKPEAEAPKRTRRSKAEIEADKAAITTDQLDADKVATKDAGTDKVTVTETEKPAKEDAPATFAEMDEDAQLEAIKAEVTRNTKKGKSADIKALLAFFEAGRASELAADQYPDFYDMVKRYSAGETVDALTGGDLD